MAADQNCQDAYDAAMGAARAAAVALKIDPAESPLAGELKQRANAIPDEGSENAVKNAFIDTMKFLKEIADEDAKMAG